MRSTKPLDGKVHVATNGIFNDLEGAARYVIQHGTGDGPQYLVWFQNMDNTVSELLVAGYMKMLDGDFWGLSTSTLAMRDIMLIYGNEGLHLDGHSRGGMTIGNALESIDKMEGSQGWLGQTTLNLFGSAYSSTHADSILDRLQDRNQKENPEDWSVMQSTHVADFVGRFIGGNSATGGSDLLPVIWTIQK